MRKHFVTILLGCIVIGVIGAISIGCGRKSAPRPDAPEQLTLYSIDGRDFDPGDEPKAEETFYGYPVLGKIEVPNADNRKEIIAALKEGMAVPNAGIALCFWPRHAIRVVDKGRTIDYVICFQCAQVEAHDGDSTSVKRVTRAPQPVLNRHLKQAGIPLAPGDKQAGPRDR